MGEALFVSCRRFLPGCRASLSFVLALQDAFLLLTVVTVLALIAVFFIRERRKQLL